jgi:triosephosphate isomerase
MLQELHVSHVLIGHSERRGILGETDEMVNKKVLRALDAQLIPVLCLGETAQQREQGATRDVVQAQLTNALKGVRLKSGQKLFVAYEPIWAIGSGNSATVADVLEVHTFIRSLLNEFFPDAQEGQLSVLYGGSVNSDNAYGFLRESEIDGVLVGGASVKINQFKGVVQAAAEVLEAQQ